MCSPSGMAAALRCRADRHASCASGWRCDSVDIRFDSRTHATHVSAGTSQTSLWAALCQSDGCRTLVMLERLGEGVEFVRTHAQCAEIGRASCRERVCQYV